MKGAAPPAWLAAVQAMHAESDAGVAAGIAAAATATFRSILSNSWAFTVTCRKKWMAQ